MDLIIEIIFSSIGVMISVAALFAGVGYFKQGKSQGKLDANNLLKDDVTELSKKVNAQDTEIARLTKEVHDLHIAINEKEQKLTEVLQILQGRDPKMQEVILKIEEYFRTVAPVMDELDKFLKGQKVVGSVLAQK